MALHRLYLDTHVFVEAFDQPRSASGRIARMAAEGQFVVVGSDYLLREVERVFDRLYDSAAAKLQVEQLQRFPLCEMIPFDLWRGRWDQIRPFVRDVADGPHFAAAATGRSEFVVTRNRRSVLSGMFAVVPLATPEDVLAALSGATAWPSADVLRGRWEAWARRSSRGPRSARSERRRVRK